MTKKGTSRKSLDDITRMIEAGEDRTVSTPPEAAPEPAAFWARAVRVDRSKPKASVHLRVDSDVLNWFKAQGRGHLTRMNEVLRSYYETQKGSVPPPRRSSKGG